jgi:hypothetical protein
MMSEYKDSVEVLRDALELSQKAQTVHAIVPTLALETALMWVDAYSKMMDSLRAEAEEESAALRAEVEALRVERDELKRWLKDKRFATENAWRGYRITQDYCNGAMGAFNEVLERLKE